MELTASDLEAIRVPRPSSALKKDPPPKAELKGHPLFDIPLPRTVIDGRYEVVQSLGSGAMGSVFLVKHLRLGKLFALKMINPTLARMPEFLSRFEREANACSRLSHPNCISVTDFGQASDGTLYMVMEVADGTLLSEVAKKGAVSLPEAIEYTRQILLGLRHAHGEGLVHRDIKLENIVKCDRDDGQLSLKILDFGMAKERPQDSHDPQITRDGMVMGTPHYMAPEQIRDDNVDARADLYAVGVTLFRLITGRTVFEGDNVLDLLKMKLRNQAPTLKEVSGTSYPEALETFIAKALQRDPADRYLNADEMLAALEQVAHKIPGMPVLRAPMPRARKIFSLLINNGGPLVKAAIVSGSAFFNGVRDEAVNWYACPEHEGKPSWPLRLKGLIVTHLGRIVLLRSLTLLTVLGLSALSLYRSWAQSDSPSTASMSPRPVSDNGIPQAKGTRETNSAQRPPVQYATWEKNAEATMKADPVLIEVALLIEQNKCRGAEKVLSASTDQVGARALYLHGRVKMCLGQTEEALSYYQKAVVLEAGYRTDTRILEDAKKMISIPNLRLNALDFMADTLGRPALPALIQLAGQYPVKVVRHHALALVEKLGALAYVDLTTALELDLNQARSCKEKREIIEKLTHVNTGGAKQVLIRARDIEVKEGLFKRRYKNECVRKDINLALSKMKNREGKP